jgi:hypothetical protein
MSAVSEEATQLVVHADHDEFYLQDLGPYGRWVGEGEGSGRPPGGWTPEALEEHRIGVEPYSIAVGTARNDRVEVTVQFHSEAPEPDLATAEHVVEADLDLPTGDLSVYGPADEAGTETHFSTRAGRYRVRVSYVPSDPPAAGVDESETGRHFRYRIDFWPSAEEREVTVVKRGSDRWTD